MKYSTIKVSFRTGLIIVVAASFFGIAQRAWADAEQIYTAPCDANGHLDIPEELSGIPEGCFNVCVSPFDPGPPPDTCPNSDGSDGGGFPGVSSGCENCISSLSATVQGGMPRWFVSEPHVNLHLEDTPLWYQPSRGHTLRFQIFFKNTAGANGAVDTSQYLIFGVGTNWYTPWRSYLQAKLAPFGPGGQFMLYMGNGSVIHVSPGYVNLETAAMFTNGGTADTYQLTFPNGARNVYGPKVTLAGTDLWFLTTMEDAAGHATTFQYTVTNNTIRLNKVADVDGLETTFQYTNTAYYSNLISRVTSPPESLARVWSVLKTRFRIERFSELDI